MGCSWDKVPLGRTGLMVTPLGLGSSYGVGTADVEHAIERGVNYLYWGSARRPGFGKAIRNAARTRRDKLVVVVQSYSRVGSLLRGSLELALRSLKIDYADLLLLGWWNEPPPRRILDAALAVRESGKARHIMISCHERKTFAKYLDDPSYGAIMVRYSAAHPGAEQEVFPLLQNGRPGIVAYTATRWGELPDPRWTPPGEQTPRASDCYRFALAQPHVDVVLSGPKDRAELDEAMQALDRGPMSADELAWMRRVGAGVKSRAPVRSGLGPMQLLQRAAARLSRSERD